MTKNSQKLQLKLRQSYGKQLLPKFLDDLSKSLNRPKESISLLDLEQTNYLVEAYKNRAKLQLENDEFTFKRIWPANEIELARKFINCLRERMPIRQMFLFRSLSEYCGAVRIDIRDLLQNAFQLIGLDQEHIVAWSDDGAFSIVFGHYEDWTEIGSEITFELRLRGKEWLLMANDVLVE
ncbi:MAG: hypothetical protein GY833_10745 [Aestuariibacter sp.]|nr:hypothetical protein [Aestuariibacter sp.]